MDDYRDVFVGIDTSKLRNAIAIAQAGHRGKVRFFGEIDNTYEATRRLVAKLTPRYQKLHFCYEAGPTGYGLHRWLIDLGQTCDVVAPSLIPRRPGARVETNRRDAECLAKLLRAGELTAVWVPDAKHEAIRDLVRAREAAIKDLGQSVNKSPPSCCVTAVTSPAERLGAKRMQGGSPSRHSSTTPITLFCRKA